MVPPAPSCGAAAGSGTWVAPVTQEVEGDRLLDRLGETFTASKAVTRIESFVILTRACGLFRYNSELDRFGAGEA